MWHDESPDPWDDGDGPDKRRHGGWPDAEGDDVVPYGAFEKDSHAAAGPRTATGRGALLAVMVVVVITTLALCCAAIGQVARLLNVDPTLF